jgi:hypothetical protein
VVREAEDLELISIFSANIVAKIDSTPTTKNKNRVRILATTKPQAELSSDFHRKAEGFVDRFLALPAAHGRLTGLSLVCGSRVVPKHNVTFDIPTLVAAKHKHGGPSPCNRPSRARACACCRI